MVQKLFLAFVVVTTLFAVAGVFWSQITSLFGNKQTVPEITVQDLRQLQWNQIDAENKAVSSGKAKPTAEYVLVDVRAESETAVSVIPDGITVSQYEANPEKHKGRTVICYCTVGYRSEIYARKLIAKGVSAKNFKGSILAWCEAKFPLETLDRQPTNRVHTYNSSYRVPADYVAVW